MTKFLSWLDILFEREKKEVNKEGFLRRKYLKILRVFLLLFVFSFAIGKINGGEQKAFLSSHGKIESTDNEEIGAQLYQRENLKNGASRLIFKLNTSTFDYQKKRIVVTQNKEKITGEVINRRYFSIQTKDFEKIIPIQIKLYSLDGEEESLVLESRFNLKAQKGKETHFSPVKASTFDQLLTHSEIKKITARKAKAQKQVDQFEQTIEADHQTIQSLQKEAEGTTVDSQEQEIQTQIDRYQEAIQSLDQKMKTASSEIKDQDQALKQLKEQEQSTHE